ncbi:ATP-binding protein [Mariniphaga sp.]|uniref:ATP-binding protein n=1 Tax=Mariniphaga sp. TaxID=1954475 RepID=UPI0035613C9A
MQIAVASGKGGTGKTTVAVSLFHFLEKIRGKKVHLADCDVEEPNDALFFPSLEILEQKQVHQYIPEIDTSVCTFCKKCVEWCEFNAITVVASRNFAQVDASFCHSCGACLVACPENAFTEKPHPLGVITRYLTENGNLFTEGRLEVGSAMQTMLIKELKKEVNPTVNFNILDSPPGTSCPVVETVSDVDYVILVTEPTPFGLHDLKITVELLQELKKPFGVVVNKAGLGSDDVYTFLKENNIELLGKIPFSRELARMYSSGELLGNIPEELKETYRGIIEKITCERLPF